MTLTALQGAVSDAVSAEEWQRRRSELTHDWLRNRILPRVHALLAIARGEAEAPREAVLEFDVALREWPERQAEISLLVDQFCHAMSPAHQFDGRFDHVAPEVTAYLRQATVEAWMERYDVANALEEVRSASAAVADSHASWILLCTSEAVHDLRSANTLAAFAEHCEWLLAALSGLPFQRAF